MLPDPRLALPTSLLALLTAFRPCFTAPTFTTFCALCMGFVAQPARRTVCGMLVGARLSQLWSHHWAHRFFSHARWSVDALSVVLARLVVDLLVPADASVPVVIDDTLFRRSGKQVHAAAWFHDGAARGQRLPFLDRPVALPVSFALVRKGTGAASRLALARALVEALADALLGRAVHVVADCACAGKSLRALPGAITWTTRLRSNAALYALAPPRAGKRGRPRLKGDRLASLADLAATATFTTTTVTRYGHTTTVTTAAIRCLWYGVFGAQQVQVVLVRDSARTTGYDIALVSTDLAATPNQLVERYASRWSIEVAIEDAKQTTGVGQARNRVPQAVERTVPFGLIVSTLVICWYASAGYHSDDVEGVRALSPWYRDKTQPSVADMVTKLRRVIIAAQFQRTDPQLATPAEMHTMRLAWAGIAA